MSDGFSLEFIKFYYGRCTEPEVPFVLTTKDTVYWGILETPDLDALIGMRLNLLAIVTWTPQKAGLPSQPRPASEKYCAHESKVLR